MLDGWWAEAYDPAYGWAIDGGSDEDDAEQLYTLLEQQVVPRFEARDAWLELMKSSIAALAPRFSMQRTVIEYADRYYVPAARGQRRAHTLSACWGASPRRSISSCTFFSSSSRCSR